MRSDVLDLNEELVSIELELTNVRLLCGGWVVQINCQFSLNFFEPEATSAIDPWLRKGDLEKLWSLIDVKCTEVTMSPNRLTIHFGSVATIDVENPGEVPELVIIWHPSVDSLVMTRYPVDIG